MKQFEWVIKDELGIHARPAGLFVKCAAKFSSDITIQYGEKTADGKRLFAVMGLGATKGQTIKIAVKGSDEAQAVLTLQEFCEQNF